MREKTSIEAVQAVMDGRLSVAQAATALNLSERQVYRALASARDEGLAGLVHGNRGRAPSNKGDDALWRIERQWGVFQDRCLKESRVVGRYHVVSFEGIALQLTSEKNYFSLARQRVEVLQLRDGSVEVHHGQRMVTRFTASAIARLIRKNARTQKRVA